MFKVHGTPRFFPNIQIWTRISSLMMILILASRPIIKGGKFYCIFELNESNTTRFHKKMAQKRLKKAKKCPNYFPSLTGGSNFFHPHSRIRELWTPVHISDLRLPPPFKIRAFTITVRSISSELGMCWGGPTTPGLGFADKWMIVTRSGVDI